jgi:solute carrier family 25 carnitine/acylcarnitine transporter 20/29
MQANQSTTPKRLKDVVGEMYKKYGWKKGIMRGYWVRCHPSSRRDEINLDHPRRLPSFERFLRTQVRRHFSTLLYNSIADHALVYVGFYAGYEWSKRSLQKSLGTQSLPVWATLTAGGIGGIAYWTAW